MALVAIMMACGFSRARGPRIKTYDSGARSATALKAIFQFGFGP